MGDFYTGYYDVGNVRVSDAVAASSAFPPGFSAFRLQRRNLGPVSRIDPWGRERLISPQRGHEFRGDTSTSPLLLTDGGVYDNLGVEPVWDLAYPILVSDAGRPFASVPRSRQSLLTRCRAAEISENQVGAVRLRWLVRELTKGRRQGGSSGPSTPFLRIIRRDIPKVTLALFADFSNKSAPTSTRSCRVRWDVWKTTATRWLTPLSGLMAAPIA